MQTSFDEFIRKEKDIRPSVFLTERIMEGVDRVGAYPRHRSERWIQAMAVAASITLALVLGIGLGKSYRTTASESVVWNIDDNRLENLMLYENMYE